MHAWVREAQGPQMGMGFTTTFDTITWPYLHHVCVPLGGTHPKEEHGSYSYTVDILTPNSP